MASIKTVLLTATLASCFLISQSCMGDEFDDWIQELNQKSAEHPDDLDAPLSDQAKAELDALNEEAVHLSNSGVTQEENKK